MITKILRYFTAAATRIHPEDRIPRHFEWQSEFLFLLIPTGRQTALLRNLPVDVKRRPCHDEMAKRKRARSHITAQFECLLDSAPRTGVSPTY